MSFLLVLLLLLPLLGAAICAFVPAGFARVWALIVSVLTLVVGIGLASKFDFHQDLSRSGGSVLAQTIDSVQIEYPAKSTAFPDRIMIGDIKFEFRLGVDSISLWLVILTVGLMPLALLASFESIKDRPKEYYAWMLVLLAAMNGVFVSRDLLLFYIFFELTLIPMFFIIGIWGGPQRRYAASKFFLFTFGGSVFTLAAVVYLGVKAGTFNLVDVVRLAQVGLTANERWWILLGLLAGFAVKVPLFPVHTWLPLAHTEAPTAGSVILAGVLLKLGTYGLMRLALPIGLISESGVVFRGFIHVLGAICVIGVIYGALVAWVQQDIKKLVAYSSVSHLGFCVLGLVALNAEGMQGSVLYMINHGLSTGAMFLVIGMVYDRFHTRDINELSGLAKKMPKLAFFFVLFMLSSIGLPGTNGFVSEFLTVLGAFTSEYLGITFGVLAAIGVILGALYMLHMTARVMFGPLKYPGQPDAQGHGTHGGDSQAHGAHDSHAHAEATDIGGREIGILIPLAIVVIVLGIFPNIILKTIRQPIDLLRSTIASPQTAVLPSPADEVAVAVETP
jgi:NADH-quinone oxidoreductase subunit M